MERRGLYRHAGRYQRCALRLCVLRKCFGYSFFRQRKHADYHGGRCAERYRHHYSRKEKFAAARCYHLDGRRVRPERKAARYRHLCADGERSRKGLSEHQGQLRQCQNRQDQRGRQGRGHFLYDHRQRCEQDRYDGRRRYHSDRQPCPRRLHRHRAELRQI